MRKIGWSKKGKEWRFYDKSGSVLQKLKIENNDGTYSVIKSDVDSDEVESLGIFESEVDARRCMNQMISKLQKPSEICAE